MMRKFCLLAVLIATPTLAAEDLRQLVKMPAPAEATFRQDMRDNIVAINEIIGLLAEGKVKESGAVAEEKIGMGMMGRHRMLPFESRPGPHMPDAMHQLNMQTHMAGHDYAGIAASGSRDKALAALNKVTSGCVACHLSYRIR